MSFQSLGFWAFLALALAVCLTAGRRSPRAGAALGLGVETSQKNYTTAKDRCKRQTTKIFLLTSGLLCAILKNTMIHGMIVHSGGHLTVSRERDGYEGG